MNLNPSPQLRIEPEAGGEDYRDETSYSRLAKEVDPHSLFYINCEIFSSFSELLDVLLEYQRFKERTGINTGYLFLDEVTALEGWWRAVKPS